MTVSNYMPKRPTPANELAPNWKRFLKNHSEFIYATDFFTVPTVFFRNLYILFIIHHKSRRVIHVNVTFSPNALWIIQQFREAFPGEPKAKYLILDRDTKFSTEVIDAIKELGIQPSPRAPRCPWQNPFVERWVGSANKETPLARPVALRPSQDANVIALRRIDGLHHRYEWQLAA